VSDQNLIFFLNEFHLAVAEITEYEIEIWLSKVKTRIHVVGV